MDTNGTSSQANLSPEEMIGQVLGNPDTVRRIGEILGRIRDDAPPTDDGAPVGTPPSTGTIPADLLSNPALLEQLPRMIQMLKPMMGLSTPPPPTEGKGSEKPPQDCRRDLLLALKPFLSPAKRDAVDTILRLSGLSAVLRRL